jgi:DNA-binding Xre family transcriptional regulator
MLFTSIYSILGYSNTGFRIQLMMLNKDRKRLLRETLKKARIDKGLRQVDLAEALGRTQSYVAKLESGEKTLDFIEVLEVCKALRLNPVTLIKALS